ncbi:MAG: tagatose 1,6-diphosphate aldolase, partial [Bryobacteraceae bacterium]
MKISDGKIKHLNALSNDKGVIAAAAMDQRGSLQKSIASGKNIDRKDVSGAMMREFKTSVARVLTPHASAI